MLLCWAAPGFAQGTGPNINFLTPVGLSTHSLSVLDVDSNFRFGQTQFGDFNFQTTSGTLNYFYRFGLFDRLALIGFNLSYVDIDGVAKFELPDIPIFEDFTIDRSGFGDPSLIFRQGLIGTPALSTEDWLAYEQGFQLSAQLGLKIPWGDYDARRVVNPGFNRYAVDVSLPMVIPVDGARRTTFLEITPKVVFFGDNDDPPFGLRREKQDELYLAEFHVMHQLSRKTWLSLGAQYQEGGGTVVDGFALDNSLQQWYGEVAIGYVLNKHFNVAFTYGEIFNASNGARGDAWRVRLGLLL